MEAPNDNASTNSHSELLVCRKELSDAQKLLARAERKLEKTRSYNEELIQELDELKKELHQQRRLKKVQKISAETQTDFSDNLQPNCFPESVLISEHTTSPVVAEQPAADPVYEPLNPELVTDDGQTQSIADQLRSVAEQAISQSDYVYDETSGLYYDHKTGYYYNPENKLYYDGNTYTYYSFNEQTGQYEFHSQADMSQYEEYYKHLARKEEKQARKTAKQARRNLRENRLTNCERKRNSTNDEKSAKRKRPVSRDSLADDTDKCDQPEAVVDSKELSSDLSDAAAQSSDTEEGELVSDDEELTPSDSSDSEPEVIWRPPCVRAIVTESDSLVTGSLHIITISGGSIGSCADGLICIAEDGVNKVHCKVTYSEEGRCYYAVELGSENGTFINTRRLSQPRESASIRLTNRDSLRVGSTQLLLHIHPGTDTCTDCEPGLIETKLKAHINQESNSGSSKIKLDVEKERRTQLKSIKMKYGLQNERYKERMFKTNPKYEDKAEQRRQQFGVDLPGIPDAPTASVDEAIPAQNKGHKLLEKMGWKTGESLGKSQTGIAEPIKVDLRLNASAGLGSNSNRTISMDEGGHLPKARKKAEILLKTQKRFEKAKTSSMFHVVDDEYDEPESESGQNTNS